MPTKELSKEERVYNLVVEKIENQRRKKAAMQEFNEENKRIDAEINELLEDEPEQAEVEA
jgi:hypothetical protein